MALGGIISLGSKVAGIAMSAFGQRREGRATQASLAYQASAARGNAVLADKAAGDALARGEQEIGRAAIQQRRFIGRQRVNLAANGVVVDQGSALDLTADTAMMGQLDLMQIKENSVREAAGFSGQAQNFRKTAELLEGAESDVGSATKLNLLSTGIAGLGSVASKWYDLRSVGAL